MIDDDYIRSTFPKNKKNIGIKMSGGADSTLLTYLLAKYIKEDDLAIKIIPVVIIEESSPFQEIVVRDVLKIINSQFDVNIELKHIFKLDLSYNKITRMREVEKELFDKNIIDLIVTGGTRRPEAEIDSNFDNGGLSGPEDNRLGVQPTYWEDEKSYSPFINFNKKILLNYYKTNNLIDILFNKTRSCVSKTQDFTKVCGECWWCRERKWALDD
jgi:tRNA(Ile)-lysidine synthase TilS/MesJ